MVSTIRQVSSREPQDEVGVVVAQCAGVGDVLQREPAVHRELGPRRDVGRAIEELREPRLERAVDGRQVEDRALAFDRLARPRERWRVRHAQRVLLDRRLALDDRQRADRLPEGADDERLGVVLGQPAQDDLVLELDRAVEHALLEVVAHHRSERRERAGEPVDAAGLGDAVRVVRDHAGGVLGVGDVELVLLDHALVDQVHAAVLNVLIGLDVRHR